MSQRSTAVLLSSIAGDAAAMFRDATGTVSAKAAVWAEESESRSRRMWASTSGAFHSTYEKSREQLGDFAESCGVLFEETIYNLRSLTQFDTKKTDGGKPDGKPESDPG